MSTTWYWLMGLALLAGIILIFVGTIGVAWHSGKQEGEKQEQDDIEGGDTKPGGLPESGITPPEVEDTEDIGPPASGVKPIAVSVSLGGTYPAPQAPKHYEFRKGVDSPGHDIRRISNLSDDVDGLKGACNEEPRCRGFNTNGWMKYQLRPEDEWVSWTNDPTRGMYLKKGPGGSSFTSEPENGYR